MSNEDLGQSRNESNYHYASRIRQYNLEKEQEKHNRTRQIQYERVMNTQTDSTGLYGANKSIHSEGAVKSARSVMKRTQKEVEAKRLFAVTMPNAPDEDLDNTIRALGEMEELQKKNKKKTARNRFIPFNPTRCIE